MNYNYFIKCQYLLICLCFHSNTYANNPSIEQMEVIKQTASSICDTVKDAKGKKSQVQLEGEVSAKLTGLVEKLADIGITGGGSYTGEQFEGLTQEATASALEGDRDCRERIFNKMFDRLSILKDRKLDYKDNGRRVDLRTLQSFMRTTPIDVSRLRDQYVCDGSDQDDSTREIRLDNQMLTITNYEKSSTERCNAGYQVVRETVDICTAEIKNLDELITVWSPPSLSIYCLTGDCVTCNQSSKWKNNMNSNWTNESREFNIDYFRVYVGGLKHVQDNEREFVSAVRALSRLISGGSDKAFCDENPYYCNEL